MTKLAFSFLVTLGIIAVFFALHGHVYAATITVDGSNCTLVDAILSANTDSDTGTCSTGAGEVVGSYGDDVLELTQDITLTSAYATNQGTPLITQPLIIRSDEPGTQRIVVRSSATNFRIFGVTNTTVTFEDLRIQNGRLIGALAIGGAGIKADDSDITLSNVHLENNFAGNACSGGGILLSSSNTLIEDSVVENNTAGNGGGISQTGGSLEVRNSEVNNNTGVLYGSAFVLQQSGVSSAEIYNSSIIENTGPTTLYVLGVFAEFDFTLENSVVSNNAGGGEIGLSKTNSEINRVTVSGNESTLDGVAGYAVAGITIKNSETTIENSTISSNTSSTANGHAGIYVVGQSDVEITNVTVSGNTAADTAGIVTDRGHLASGRSIQITHATITDNTGDATGLVIRGDSGDDSIVEITNTLSAENNGSIADSCSINDYGAAGNATLVSHGGNIFGSIATSPTSLSCFSSLIGSDGYDITDAGLEDLDDNGGETETHALALESEAIDHGVLTSVDEDQRGYDRPLDGNGDGLLYPDTGAYEAGEVEPEPDDECSSMNCLPQLANFACKDQDADPRLSALFIRENDPRFDFFIHNPAYCRYANFDFSIEPLTEALQQDILDEPLPTTPPVPPLACPFFNEFIDPTSPLTSNTRSQIALWQWLLGTYFEEPVTINGVYDIATQTAIIHFQEYMGEVILRPWTWGPSKITYHPTGRVYKLTQAVGNILLDCHPTEKVWVEDAQQEYDVLAGMREHYPSMIGSALRAIISGSTESLIPSTPADFVQLRLRVNDR